MKFIGDMCGILIQLSLKYIAKGEIDCSSTLIRVIGLARNRWLSITFTNVGRVDASLGINEFAIDWHSMPYPKHTSNL